MKSIFWRRALPVFLCFNLIASESFSEDKDVLAKTFTTCETLLKAVTFKKKISNYMGAVKQTRGRRIFSVPAEYNDTPNLYSPWFQNSSSSEKKGVIHRSLQLLPRLATKKWQGGPYDFTPLRALESLTWGRYTEKKFGVRERPAKWVVFSTAFLLSILGYSGASHWANRKTAEKLVGDINTNSQFYDYYIENDFRSKAIADDLKERNITPDQARLDLFLNVRLPYAQWFANRQFYINQPVSYLRSHLINFSLFYPLKNIVENGVKPTEGFIVSPSAQGPLSDGQVRRLFNETDTLAIRDEFITRDLKLPSNLEDDIDPSLFTPDIKSEVLDDPFNKDLRAMEQKHEITLGQLLYGMEEEEYWKSEFEKYDTLHITPLARDNQGIFTSNPLTLQELQREIIIDLKRRASS